MQSIHSYNMYKLLRTITKKNHKLGVLKQQKFLVSQLWRLDVQNQGVGKAMLLLKPVGENPYLPLPSFLVAYQ